MIVEGGGSDSGGCRRRRNRGVRNTERPAKNLQKVERSTQLAGKGTFCCRPKSDQSRLTLLSNYSVGTYQENDLARHSSGNVHPRSSQLTEPLWTGPWPKRRTDARELISTQVN